MTDFLGLLTGFILNSLIFLGSMFGLTVSEPVSHSASQGTTTAVVKWVIDGDTIDVQIAGAWESTLVRYIGIDTPEPYAKGDPECGSKEATARNQELVEGKEIVIVPGTDPYDKYGRLLAYVYVDDIFVNQVLVAEGYATVLMIKPNTKFKTNFNDLYQQAQVSQLGIWSVCE